MDRSLRRTTLGPMSTADITRTLSLDDSRLSFGVGPGPSRSSIGAPTRTGKMGSRRDSFVSKPTAGVGSGGGSGAPKVDPRPITSKQFLSDTIAAVVEYCQETGYRSGPISAKLLANPTGKDFANVVSHLYQRIDASFAITGRVEDDVQAGFKMLRYPFLLSKTSLSSVGSPTTYPAILAALGWLVELLRYDEAACEADPLLGSAGAALDDADGFSGPVSEGAVDPARAAFFFDALKECYGHFLAGEDEDAAAVDARVAASYGTRQRGVEAEIDRLRAANAAALEELAAARGVQSTLPLLKAQQASLAVDTEGARRAVLELEGERDALNATLLQHQRAMRDAERTAEGLADTLAGVQRAVASQDLSPGDVDRLAARKAGLREEHASLQAQVQAAHRGGAEAEASLKKSLAELAARIGDYSTQATRLQLLPVGAKYAFGRDISVRLREGSLQEVGAGGSAASGGPTADGANSGIASAATTAALLACDIKGTVKPLLRELRSKLARQAAEHSRQGSELGDTLGSLGEAVGEAHKQLEAGARTLRAREDALATLRSEAEAALAEATAATDSLQAQLEAVRSGLAGAAAGGLRDETIRNEQLKLASFQQNLKHKRAEARVRLGDFLVLAEVHKERVCEQLEGLRSRVQARRDAELAQPRRARHSTLVGSSYGPSGSGAAAGGGDASVFARLPPTPGRVAGFDETAQLGASAENARHGDASSSFHAGAAQPAPYLGPYDDTAPAGALAPFGVLRGPAVLAGNASQAAGFVAAGKSMGAHDATAGLHSYEPLAASRRLGFEGL